MMSDKNNIQAKSFAFSVRIVKLYQFLSKEHKEYVLSKQLLRSGTSVGANVNEAQAAQTKADFVSKMSIASKEAREAKYWLDLLSETQYLNKNEPHVQSLLEQSEELIKILTSIVKTAQQNLKNEK
ncbi:four helix bundle protein [Thiosulfatimonas sediminis]|nr:four helix bundle protein [Thiosulfatimonas sediminis]